MCFSFLVVNAINSDNWSFNLQNVKMQSIVLWIYSSIIEVLFLLQFMNDVDIRRINENVNNSLEFPTQFLQIKLYFLNAKELIFSHIIDLI